MDRSKYRNPDRPVGHTKTEAELVYKYGVEIDGEYYEVAPYIWETRMHERPDYATLSDLEFSDDENIAEDAATYVPAEQCSTASPDTAEKEKETVIIKKEPEENVISEKKSSKHKKGHDGSDISAIESSVSHMDIKEKHEKKKKAKKVKKEKKDDYPEDSSSLSSSHRHSRSPSSSSRKHKLVRYSPSPSPERSLERSPVRYLERSPDRYRERSPDRYRDVKIKEEPLDQPQHLFGSYHCDICNITMNSLLTYNTHVNGKRHRKNMKVKNVSEVVAQSIPATVVSEDQTKYPKPRSGIIRKKVQSPAIIQHIIEKEVKVPVPGLNYVTEIQGIECVQYYCSMCDSVCSSNSIIPHLTGFKHQLKSVKQFKPGAYEYMHQEPKYRIEKELLSILRAVQKKDGMGRMAVEVEELAPDSQDMPFGEFCISRDYRSQPSTSREMGRDHLGMSFPEIYDKATIPDKGASDFFCEICDSHMNSLQMWEAHIRGKRHLTNLKKMPGDRPSKNKTILVPNRRAYLLDRLEAECPDEPVVGLQEIRETVIPETKSHSYQCFLCGSCHTTLDIVEHVISLKHRTKYLDHIDYPGREVISGMSELNSIALVEDMCRQVEMRDGRGKPHVYMSKSAMYR